MQVSLCETPIPVTALTHLPLLKYRKFHWKKIGISCGYFSAGFLQDTCIPNALQQSSYNPAPDTSCDPLHFLHIRTCRVHMHMSLPIPDVILARPCSPPYHMILVISCTSGLVVCTCTCPYPLLMWSLPGPVVLHAWKTSLTCKLHGYD